MKQYYPADMKIAIIGGGSAGWMCASYMAKYLKDVRITVIESPSVGTIDVGESTGTHFATFINKLGIDVEDMMRETGATYKLGTNYAGWTGKDSQDYFHFKFNQSNTNFDKKLDKVRKHNGPVFDRLKLKHNHSIRDYITVKTEDRLTDTFLSAYNSGQLTDFDDWHGWDSFSKHNKFPAELFTQRSLQYAYHVNSEQLGKYLRDKVAIPAGVRHIRSHINDIQYHKGSNAIRYVMLEHGGFEVADLYIDCTGFKKLLVSDRHTVQYDTPANTAYVCQRDYNNPAEEMLNCTRAQAMDRGWCFEISLFHRQGTGYVTNSDVYPEQELIDEFTNHFKHNKEPRKLKWVPERLENQAKHNVVAIGISNGFIEPMDANMFGIIANGITNTVDTIRAQRSLIKTQSVDWTEQNKNMAAIYDDVRDFILAHYTLSNRPGDFWEGMRAIGRSQNHADMVRDKYMNPANEFRHGDKQSFFPDILWLQLAINWGLDVSDWVKEKPCTDYVQYQMDTIGTLKQQSPKFPNNYTHLQNIYGMKSEDFKKKLLGDVD